VVIVRSVPHHDNNQFSLYGTGGSSIIPDHGSNDSHSVILAW
jgi:hypothetical protein